MFKRIPLTGLLGLVLSLSPVWAQTSHNAHDHSAVTSSAGAQAVWSEGEVKKIDKAQMKITLRHGEIPSLNMPPMTMVFKVQQGASWDQLNVGDRVRFMAVRSGQDHVVTAIERAH